MTDSVTDVKKNVLSFTGKIHLIRSNAELDTALENLGSAKILGFDTETKPAYKKGQIFKVALLQLATENDAFLIRLHEISQFQKLTVLFENSDIIKTGVAIHDDIKALQKLFKFKAQSFVELQTLAKEKGLTKFGLKGMAEELLQGTVNKGSKMTNWERLTLTKDQLRYAATDAWIGLKLYEKIQEL